MRVVPLLFEKKDECCGCTACYAACPHEAISMDCDEEGFLYPHINVSICVGCNICLNVCPIKCSWYKIDELIQQK